MQFLFKPRIVVKFKYPSAKTIVSKIPIKEKVNKRKLFNKRSPNINKDSINNRISTI